MSSLSQRLRLSQDTQNNTRVFLQHADIGTLPTLQCLLVHVRLAPGVPELRGQRSLGPEQDQMSSS